MILFKYLYEINKKNTIQQKVVWISVDVWLLFCNIIHCATRTWNKKSKWLNKTLFSTIIVKTDYKYKWECKLKGTYNAAYHKM